MLKAKFSSRNTLPEKYLNLDISESQELLFKELRSRTPKSYYSEALQILNSIPPNSSENSFRPVLTLLSNALFVNEEYIPALQLRASLIKYRLRDLYGFVSYLSDLSSLCKLTHKPSYYLLLACAYIDYKKNYEIAISILDQALSKKDKCPPNLLADIYYQQGYCFLKISDMEYAAECFELCCTLNPLKYQKNCSLLLSNSLKIS